MTNVKENYTIIFLILIFLNIFFFIALHTSHLTPHTPYASHLTQQHLCGSVLVEQQRSSV